MSQVLRWNRTTVRSNAASLLTDRTVWKTQAWCVYAVYITSFVNFALFYDAALLYTFTKSLFSSRTRLLYLASWVLSSKLFKLIPHFWRHPADLIYLPGYYIFAYAHSFIKLYAFLTFWNTTWGGRNLDDAGVGRDSSVQQPSPAPSDSAPWGTVTAESLHMTPADILMTRQAEWESYRKSTSGRGKPDPSGSFNVQDWWTQACTNADILEKREPDHGSQTAGTPDIQAARSPSPTSSETPSPTATSSPSSSPTRPVQRLGSRRMQSCWDRSSLLPPSKRAENGKVF